jgi:uncharacterized protein
MVFDKNKKICVIGVSHKEDKFGYRIFSDLLKAGYRAEGVNPTDGMIAGKKIYRSLKELPEKPDLLITVVPHQVTERVIEEANELGINEIWMQPGSESELAIRKAQEYKMSLVYDSCFMKEAGIW